MRQPRENARRWIADGVILLVVLTAAGILWLFAGGADEGVAATVTSPDGTRVIALFQNGDTVLTGQAGHTVTLRVEDGKIRFLESDCPDRICVNSGWLSRAGQTAACVPAGITVRIDGETATDAVAR